VSFAAITLCVACQRVFTLLLVDFVIDSVRKRLDKTSCARARARVCVACIYLLCEESRVKCDTNMIDSKQFTKRDCEFPGIILMRN
jgi:hypothetical protein